MSVQILHSQVSEYLQKDEQKYIVYLMFADTNHSLFSMKISVFRKLT